MDCGVPFCHNGCPLGNLIPDWNDLVYHDRFEDAIAQLHATNNFPEFTGRLCPAPCEAACVLEIREGDAVTIKQIENAIVNRAWEEGWIVPAAASAARRASRSPWSAPGPAGMAAAQQLRRAGHSVTLFERDEAAGGLVRFGVPDFKIEKAVVQRRVEQMVAEGVELRCGVDVGSDVTRRRSCARASTRSCWPRARACRATCPSPAASSAGCTSRWTTSTSATAGSRESSSPQPPQPTVAQPAVEQVITAAGKDVVVIGGGDTGADCVGNALREGARSIVQLELLPEPPAHRPDERTPWPEWPLKYRLSYAMEEARKRAWASRTTRVTTTHFCDDGSGRVAALQHRPGRTRAAVRAPCRAPSASCRRSWCCWRWASWGRAGAARPARRRARPARQRQGGQALHDLGRGRVRRRRRPSRAVADRVGDQRGPPVRADG